MESSGKHMICDIKNIENIELLHDFEGLRKMLKMICEKYQFEILQEFTYLFDPQGCSILFLLSESHMSIHTFPERKHCSLDIYTCRQFKDDHVYKEIYAFLISELKASEKSVCTILDRYF